MPLKGSEEALASALKEKLRSSKSFDEAWDGFTTILINHFTENALVVGTTPNGGPLEEGKLQ